MPKVLEPSKELRFARTMQAVIFAVLAAVLLAMGVTLLLITYTVHNSQWGLAELPFPLWFLALPWLPIGLCVWMSIHCMRHPFLIFSPIGIEIFPLWRPIKNFNLVEWGRVADVEVNDHTLTLHYNKEQTGGVVLALAPLSKKSRILLKQAVMGVMDQRNKTL